MSCLQLIFSMIVLLLNFLPYAPFSPFRDLSSYTKFMCCDYFGKAGIHEICTIFLFYVQAVVLAVFYFFAYWYCDGWIEFYYLLNGFISLLLVPWYDFSIYDSV